MKIKKNVFFINFKVSSMSPRLFGTKFGHLTPYRIIPPKRKKMLKKYHFQHLPTDEIEKVI